MLTKPYETIWFLCGPQNGNAGNGFVLQNNVTSLLRDISIILNMILPFFHFCSLAHFFICLYQSLYVYVP